MDETPKDHFLMEMFSGALLASERITTDTARCRNTALISKKQYLRWVLTLRELGVFEEAEKERSDPTTRVSQTHTSS